MASVKNLINQIAKKRLDEAAQLIKDVIKSGLDELEAAILNNFSLAKPTSLQELESYAAIIDDTIDAIKAIKDFNVTEEDVDGYLQICDHAIDAFGIPSEELVSYTKLKNAANVEKE